MDDDLNFSYNWNNKLNCKIFTTLRISNRFIIGQIVKVSLKEKYLKDCKVIGKKKIHINSINEYIAGLDTGYSVEECKKILYRMYKNINWNSSPLYLYLLQEAKQ